MDIPRDDEIDAVPEQVNSIDLVVVDDWTDMENSTSPICQLQLHLNCSDIAPSILFTWQSLPPWDLIRWHLLDPVHD